MADTKECAAVGALRRPRRTPEMIVLQAITRKDDSKILTGLI